LNHHAQENGPPIVVLGESGSGKSALLAKWASQYRSSHPNELFIMHFIGATSFSADWAAMLRMIMGEFKRRFAIQLEIPDQPDALRSAFANWLHMAAAGGRVVVILDALNQLEDRDGAPDLVWLPDLIPENIRMIVSTLPGRPLDELTNRGWPVLIVKALEIEERKQLISDYLAQYTKVLSPKFVERISNVPQTSNPLYLRTLLEELRLYGDHFTLEKRIEHYLGASKVEDLYEKILQRYEQDYERDRPGLVREAMSLLWAARRGLAETELLDMLGTNGNPLPRAYWSPLFLAVEQSLVNRSGLIGFFHDYMRQAVRDRYLPEANYEIDAHLRLAEYFGDRDISLRKVDELPWQMVKARSWNDLYRLLSEMPFFRAAWDQNRFDVMSYWAVHQRNSPLSIVDAYQPVLQDPEQHAPYVWHVALLLDNAGYVGEALKLQRFLVDYCLRWGPSAVGDLHLSALPGLLGAQANTLYKLGDIDGAMNLHREAEQMSRKLGDQDGLQTTLGNQAVILGSCGDLDGAINLLKAAEAICREIGNKNGLQSNLGNLATILFRHGDLDGAMKLHKEQEQICRELGNKEGISACMGNQANVLEAHGDLEGAARLHKEQENICRELGNKYGIAASLGNQAVILRQSGDPAAAMALQKEVEKISRDIGRKDLLAASLANQALILEDQGEVDSAMLTLQQAANFSRELGTAELLATCLLNQARLLSFAAKDSEALDTAEQAYELAANQGFLSLVDKMKPAIEKLRSRLHRRKAAVQGRLPAPLMKQGSALYQDNHLEGAMTYYKEAEKIYRDLGDLDGLNKSLENQASVLVDRGDLEGAMLVYKEAEGIWRKLGNRLALAQTLGNQALILADQGDLDGSMKLLAEQEKICRDLRDMD
jgi:tetratricopeptide (TPR) repeat protein